MTRYKHFIWLVFLSMSASTICAQSLNDYMRLAAENSPNLKSKYAEFEASIQRIKQVSSFEDPRLSFGYFISPVETRVGPQKAKIGLSQMLPWFGTLKAKEEIAALNAEARYQEFIDAKNALYRDVKAAWYPIYEVNTVILLQRANRDILRSYKILSTSSFKNGKGSMIDVLRVEILLENTETEIQLLLDKKIPLITQFNKILNRADTTPVQILDSLSVEQVIDQYRKDSLLISNPTLTVIDLQLKSAQTQEELAKKLGFPKFGLGIDYVLIDKNNSSIADNGKDVLMPMVSASLPIFRGKYKAAVREAQLIQSAVLENRKNRENMLVSMYASSWYDLIKAKQLIALYNAQITKSNQVLSLLLSSYRNSGKEFEEVLRTQQELLKYRVSETSAIKDYYTALAKLDYLTSKKRMNMKTINRNTIYVALGTLVIGFIVGWLFFSKPSQTTVDNDHIEHVKKLHMDVFHASTK